MNVSRSKMQLMLIFLKIWKSLRVKNATKASSRINKFLTLSMYHHLCLFLHVIQQNYFTSLKVTKRELQSKTWEIHTITLFIPVNCSSRGITWNSRDGEVQTTKKFQILLTCVLSPPLKTYMILAQRSITICNWHKYALVAKAHIWFDIGDILRSFFIS